MRTSVSNPKLQRLEDFWVVLSVIIFLTIIGRMFYLLVSTEVACVDEAIVTAVVESDKNSRKHTVVELSDGRKASTDEPVLVNSSLCLKRERVYEKNR